MINEALSLFIVRRDVSHSEKIVAFADVEVHWWPSGEGVKMATCLGLGSSIG